MLASPPAVPGMCFWLGLLADFREGSGAQPSQHCCLQSRAAASMAGSPGRQKICRPAPTAAKLSRALFQTSTMHVSSQDTDPLSRWTPRQALQHPFITRRAFTGPFLPPPDPHPPSRPPEHPTPPCNANPIYMPGLAPYPSMPPTIPASIAAALATSPEAHMQVGL